MCLKQYIPSSYYKLKYVIGEDKQDAIEEGISELHVNGELQLPSDDLEASSICPDSESVNETMEPTAIENKSANEANSMKSPTSNEEKGNSSVFVNEDMVQEHVAEPTTIPKAEIVENLDNESTIEQQNTLATDDFKTEISEGAFETKIQNLESELIKYKKKYEILFSNSNVVDSKLLDAEKKLKESNLRLEQKDVELSEMELKLHTTSSLMKEELLAAEKCKTDATQAEQLRSQLAEITSEKNILSIENNRLQEIAMQMNSMSMQRKETARIESDHDGSNNFNDIHHVKELEKSLNEANEKISDLLKVKEKYAEVDMEKTNLGNNLSELEEEMDVLSFQTRATTACSMIPLVILVLAIMVAYLPYLSSLFGTID